MSMYPIEDWRFFARLLRRCNCPSIEISVFLSIWRFYGLFGYYVGEIVTGDFGFCSDISVLSFDIRCMYI